MINGMEHGCRETRSCDCSQGTYDRLASDSTTEGVNLFRNHSNKAVTYKKKKKIMWSQEVWLPNHFS